MKISFRLSPPSFNRWQGVGSILSVWRAIMIKFSEETDRGNWLEQTAQLGDLTIVLGKSKKALSNSAEFLPNKVMKGDAVLWQFDKYRHLATFAFLREVAGEVVIVYATRTTVAEVIPAAALADAILLRDGNYDWKRSPLALLKLKLATAEAMELDCMLSPIEMILKRKLEEAMRSAVATQSAAIATERQQEHEARLAARKERRRAIMMRDRIEVYTASGDKKKGVPIVGDEWQALGNGVDCITVASCVDGVATGPTEHFFVKVEGSKKSRQRTVAVFAEDPTKPKLIEKMGDIVVEVNGELDIVACYTRDGLAALKTNGLNSGAIRGVWPANENGSHTLVSFAKGGTKDIGNFMPVA